MSDRPRPSDERDFVFDIEDLRSWLERQKLYAETQQHASQQFGDAGQARYWYGYRNAIGGALDLLQSAFSRRARACLERARMDRLSDSDIEEETRA